MCLVLDSCNLLSPPSWVHVSLRRARITPRSSPLTVASRSTSDFLLPRRYVYPPLQGRSWCVSFRAGLPLLAPRSRTGTFTDWWEPLGLHRRFDRSGVGDRLLLGLLFPRGFLTFILLSSFCFWCLRCMHVRLPTVVCWAYGIGFDVATSAASLSRLAPVLEES